MVPPARIYPVTVQTILSVLVGNPKLSTGSEDILCNLMVRGRTDCKDPCDDTMRITTRGYLKSMYGMSDGEVAAIDGKLKSLEDGADRPYIRKLLKEYKPRFHAGIGEIVDIRIPKMQRLVVLPEYSTIEPFKPEVVRRIPLNPLASRGQNPP